MSFSRLVLCLTLLGSSLAFAQTPEEWTPYTPPADPGTTPPPLVPATPPSEAPAPSQPPPSSEATPPSEALPPSEAPPPYEPPAPTRPWSERTRSRLIPGKTEAGQAALRLVVDPWAGSITGMVGLVIGAIPTAIAVLPFCLGAEHSDSTACRIVIGTGLSLSYTAGAALGIYFVGKVMDGRGEGLPTFLAALAGAAVGAGIGVSTQSTPVLVLSLAVAPLVGAMLGYEFSNGMNPPPDQPGLQTRSRFRVMPMASTTPRGGFLGGLAGQF